VFLVGIIIFVSDDTVLFGTNTSADYLLFKCIVYMIATLGLLLNLNRKIIRSNGSYFLFSIVASILFTSLSHLDFRGGYFYQIWMVFLAFLIVQFLDFDVFVNIFRKYVFVLSLLSVVVFIIANYYDWMLDYFSAGENSAGVNFVNLYISSVYKDVAEIRNASIFREPGVFMIYILIAVVFEFFISNKLNVKFLSVLFITLFTTFSTAGLIILASLLFGYIFKENEKKFNRTVFSLCLFSRLFF